MHARAHLHAQSSPGADVAVDGTASAGGEASLGADVVSPVHADRRGAPGPGADVGGASPVSAQMWEGRDLR